MAAERDARADTAEIDFDRRRSDEEEHDFVAPKLHVTHEPECTISGERRLDRE